MLGSNGRVIEPCRDGMRLADLRVVILHHKGFGAMQDTDRPARQSCAVVRGIESSTPGFHADQVDVALVEKFREDTDRVGTPTDAGDYYIGQLAKRLQALFLGFRTDDSVELLDDPRVGVRTSRRSQQVVGVLIGCRPL